MFFKLLSSENTINETHLIASKLQKGIILEYMLKVTLFGTALGQPFLFFRTFIEVRLIQSLLKQDLTE